MNKTFIKMKFLPSLLALFLLFNLKAQERKQFYSVALTNSNPAAPFTKFAGLVKQYHPGIEVGWQRKLKEKPGYYWNHQVQLGYFFHRFVQHGITAYTMIEYNRKLSSRLDADLSIGGGYFHSIPATAVFELKDNGEYSSAKGIGRPQAMAAFAIGGKYHFKNSKTIFLKYQQRLQAPFIKSYVPVLPYNNMILGIQLPINKVKE
jgi:hypothetical protein